MKQWYEFLFNSALQLVMFNTTTYLVCIIIKYVQYLQNECGVVAVPPKVYFQTSQSRLKFFFFEYNNPAKKLFSPCVRDGDSQAHNVHKNRKS